MLLARLSFDALAFDASTGATNDPLIRRALNHMRVPVSDPTLRSALLAEGFEGEDVDLHLDHLLRVGVAELYVRSDGTALWRYTLVGRDLVESRTTSPIGFH